MIRLPITDENPQPAVARVFSSEVDTGSRKENTTNQETKARF
jgi:hypothetical protein